MSFQRIYNIFDFYGYRPKLFIGGYSKNGTLVGVLSSFSSIIFLLAITIYYMKQLIINKSLTTISSTRSRNNDDIIKLNKNSSFFAFCLEHPETSSCFIDESIYTYKVSYRKGIKNEEGIFKYNSTVLNVTRCSKKYFGNRYQDVMNTSDLENMYCVPQLNHNISGSFSEKEYDFITIRLYPCINQSNATEICQDQDVIDSYLKGTIFTLEYQSFNFDPNNYNEPTKPIKGDFFTTISSSYYKEIYLYFKKFILKTDNGLIFENIESENMTAFDYSNDMMSFKTTYNYFIQVTIRMSSNVEEVLRKYQKIQTILSYIGGFNSLIQNILLLFNQIFMEIFSIEKIINKIFFYDKNEIKFQNKRKFVKTLSNHNVNFNHNISYEILNKFEMTDLPKRNISFINFSKIKEKKTYDKKKSLLLIKKLYRNQISCNENKDINNNVNYKLNNNQNNLLKINKIKKLHIFYCKSICFKLKRFKKFHDVDSKFYIKAIELFEQKLDIINIIKESFQTFLIKQIIFETEYITLLENYIKYDLINIEYNPLKTNIDNNNIIDENAIKSYDIIFNRNLKKDYNNDDLDENKELLDKIFINFILKQNQ